MVSSVLFIWKACRAMNERIKELIAQATKRYEPDWNGAPAYDDFNKEVFAQLIIRECVELNRQELSFSAFARMLDKYEEHFGVEE
jgi:hypothetical protein